MFIFLLLLLCFLFRIMTMPSFCIRKVVSMNPLQKNDYFFRHFLNNANLYWSFSELVCWYRKVHSFEMFPLCLFFVVILASFDSVICALRLCKSLLIWGDAFLGLNPFHLQVFMKHAERGTKNYPQILREFSVSCFLFKDAKAFSELFH